MKGIFINANEKTVTEFEYNEDIDQINELLNSMYFTTVRYDSSMHTLFVDDMGLFTNKPMFTIGRYAFPLKGNGVILGHDRQGDTVDCSCTADDIRAIVGFEGEVSYENKVLLASIAGIFGNPPRGGL